MSNIFNFFIVLCLAVTGARAISQERDSSALLTLNSIEVRGNKKVEARAIRKLLKHQEGDALDPIKLREDIKRLYKLGYFSDIKMFKDSVNGETKLIVEVKEKPSVTEIVFEGFVEVTEDELNKKLATELYRVVNTSVITDDIRMMTLAYAQKGYYLADIRYEIIELDENKARLVFKVTEGSKVRVSNIEIIGNKNYTTAELVEGFITQPSTRFTNFSSRSVYQEVFVNRDNEFMAIFYKNHGYAKVKTSKPILKINNSKEFVDVVFKVEEGLKYTIGAIEFSGDQLFEADELREEFGSKVGEIFNYSKFVADVNRLDDKYGDKGYAYAVVTPNVQYDDASQTVNIDLNANKGSKVYIGNVLITGNSKTRDNVLRREIELQEGELFSGLRLSESKKNIERLGFFDEVQVVKEKNIAREDLIDLRVRVKEKSTGQLQAAIGFNPSNGTSQSQFFGQGRYEEKNQSGKGWRTSLAGRWNRGDNYSLSLDFLEPRLRDSDWSLGVKVFLESQVNPFFGSSDNSQRVDVQEKRAGGSVSVGKRIFERVRATVTYKLENIENASEQFLLRRFLAEGVASSLIFSLSRNVTNNYIDPSEGSDVSLSQQFTGGLLGGDREFAETTLQGTYYYPIDFTETYRTYFRFHAEVSHVYTFSGDSVPFYERYRLGGSTNMRGFEPLDIGPKFNILQVPGGASSVYNKGGDKKLFLQLEYFFPLIPEAGLKTLLFTDIGRVYDVGESIEFKDFKKDIGFGFRWITPIAPFRFEWAYPIEDGRLGDQRFIFYFGY